MSSFFPWTPREIQGYENVKEADEGALVVSFESWKEYANDQIQRKIKTLKTVRRLMNSALLSAFGALISAFVRWSHHIYRFEGGTEVEERCLGLDLRDVEGTHHRGDEDEEQGFEGGSEDHE